MYRIDNSTAATTLVAPTPPGPQPGGFFTGGTPTTGGGSPTRVDAEWLNMVQEEISNVILAGLGALDKSDRTQLLKALQGLTRTKLAANLDLYVAPTGNDANSGLSGAPFATMQRAWNYIIGGIDMNGFNVTVHVADGTYTTPLNASGFPLGFGGGNSITFTGDTTTPANCAISVNNNHAIDVSGGAAVQFQGFRLIAAGTASGGIPASGIVTTAGTQVTFTGNMDFGPCAGKHLWAGGSIAFNSGYTISGAAQSHLLATNNGFLIHNTTGATVTVSGAPTFAQGFANVTQCGNIYSLGSAVTFSGAAHGPTYEATLNGTIFTNGAGPSHFPGDAAPVVGSGGQYV